VRSQFDSESSLKRWPKYTVAKIGCVRANCPSRPNRNGRPSNECNLRIEWPLKSRCYHDCRNHIPYDSFPNVCIASNQGTLLHSGFAPQSWLQYLAFHAFLGIEVPLTPHWKVCLTRLAIYNAIIWTRADLKILRACSKSRYSRNRWFIIKE